MFTKLELEFDKNNMALIHVSSFVSTIPNLVQSFWKVLISASKVDLIRMTSYNFEDKKIEWIQIEN